MTWVIPWSRRSARIERVDNEADHQNAEQMINGFVCEASIRALTMNCPACGALHEIKAGDRRSRAFAREKQRFACSRCRFAAPVYVIVDVGVRPAEERRGAAQ
jgi:transposase-like protein